MMDRKKEEKIKVLYVEPNKLPTEMIIDNTLEKKQELVGGYIQCACLLDDDTVSLICNEEGKILGLPLNRDIGHDIIAGTFIIAGNDDSTGEFISLTDEQKEKYKNIFDEHSIEKTHKKIARCEFEIAKFEKNHKTMHIIIIHTKIF